VTSGAWTSVAGFAALLLTGLVLEVAARLGRGQATAAQALEAAMRTSPGRAAVLLVWVWLGVHFLAR
jgi:Family of unknown function (DUF6186)